MNLNARDVLPNGMSPSLPTSTTQISLPSLPSMSDSPLSRASMIANPPTPLPTAKAVLIPPPISTLPVPQMQPHHSQDSQRSQESAHTTASSSRRREKEASGSQQQLQVPNHHHQRVKSSPGTGKIRQTETFRLARSPSGNVLPNSVGQGFVAEGEMWEVVGTASEEKKSRREKSTKSKEKEKEQEREKEKEREREREKEREKERAKERERERDREKEQQRASGSSGATPSREKSKKHDRGSTEDVDSDQKGRHRRSVNGRHDHSSSSSTPTARTPTSEIPPMRPGNPERRRSSTKDIRDSRPDTIRATQTRRRPTRPSSEFQTGHDINALKAKEAWDLERLWKGRSMMYGPDGTALVSTRPTIGSDSRPSTIMSADIHRATSIPSVADLHRATTMPANHAHGHGPTHGSSHTYFVVQAPPPGVPHGAPYPGYQAPPPIIYAPTPDPAGPLPFARRDYPKTQRSFPDHIPFPSAPDLSPPRKSLANPLPEPPRLSSYRPGPLPESLAGSTEGTASPEFWTKYAGVTTLH
ncbi:hypothetical protein NLI96_g10109 [Meripilus lineatus]|uniref:Uncharacterized protein n=1 Tax=Meripilus lineatus TaxID=2056292 RepID=A0AAD5YEM0_9APHY|nr:hypothetical protein NLI96_g10109 [Physisporinus lineatus]